MSVGELVADGSLLIAIPIAMLAGAISFLSPCVLPLVPGYLGFIGGAVAPRPAAPLGTSAGPTVRAGMGTGAVVQAGVVPASVPESVETPDRRRLVLGVLLFIAGFTVVFVSMAILGGTLGRLLLQYSDVITRILGVFIIGMGLVFIGWFRPAQRNSHPNVRGGLGLVGAPLLGVALGVGWAPCIGPTLAVILTMAFDSGSTARAAMLGVAYSLGLGIPFLLVTLGFGWATRSVAFVRRHIRVINLIGGGLLIVLGLLMVTGVWTALMAPLQSLFSTVPAPL